MDKIQCADASMIRHGSNLQVERGKRAWCQSKKSNRWSIPGYARFMTEIAMRHGIWHQVTSGEGNLGSEGNKVQARCQLQSALLAAL